MADDVKELRIVAVQEGSQETSSAPTPSPERDEQDRQRNELEDILRAIREASDDAPIFSSISTDQLRAVDVFGEESEARRLALVDLYKEFPELAELHVARAAGRTRASAAGASAGVASGATTAAAGAAGGVIPPTPPIAGVAGAASPGAAGGGIAAGGMAAAALTASELALALSGLTFAFIALTEIVDAVFQGISQGWKELSADIATAEAQREIELLEERLRTEPQVADEIAAATQVRAGVDKEWLQFRAHIIEIIGPAVVSLLEVLRIILTEINAMLAIIKLFLKPILEIWKGINWIISFAKGSLTDMDDRNENFQEEVKRVLSGQADVGLRTAPPGTNPVLTPPQARHFPKNPFYPRR